MPLIHLVFGPQGAGKSTYAAALAERERGVVLAIDPWMQGLFGPDLPRPISLPWVMERVGRCEARIWQTARDVAARGVPVVLDLGFMRRADRTRVAEQARQAGLPVQAHWVSADAATRRARVMARNQTRGGTFAFEVSPAMFDAMEARFEAPDDREMAAAIVHQG